MDIQAAIYDQTNNFPVDFVPAAPAAVNTGTGLVQPPLAWNKSIMVSGRVSPPAFQYIPEWTGVDAEIVGGNLVVRGWIENFSGTTSDSEGILDVWLDTDMNAATGFPVGPKGATIGADYKAETVISMGEASLVPDFALQNLRTLFTTSLNAADNTVWSTGSGPNHPGSWTVTIPLKLLGSLGSRLRMYLTIGVPGANGAEKFVDIAPESPLVINISKA